MVSFASGRALSHSTTPSLETAAPDVRFGGGDSGAAGPLPISESTEAIRSAGVLQRLLMPHRATDFFLHQEYQRQHTQCRNCEKLDDVEIREQRGLLLHGPIDLRNGLITGFGKA